MALDDNPSPSPSTARLSQIKAHIAATNQPAASKQQHDPSVVLIFGWTAAPPSALDRFTKQYQNLYPTATVLLFTVTFMDLFLPLAHQTSRSSNRGLAELLTATEHGSPRILVHIFSGGGAARFGTIASLYRQQRGCPLPIRVVICDSAPSDVGSVGRARTLNDAIFFANSPWFVKEFTRPFVMASLGAAHLWTLATFQEEPTRKGRESLLDPLFVPKDAVRVYVYSTMDHIVTASEVERHIKRARELQLEVIVEKYTDSVHVGHAKKDPQRYWGLIERTWRGSCE